MTESTPGEDLTASLDDMTWWMHDNTCIGMGAERQFDYTLIGNLGSDLSPRLGECYVLAVGAFTGWQRLTYHREYRASLSQEPEPVAAVSVPAPVALVHGWWKHPEEEEAGINHAWVILEDGRIWEPITGLICDPVLFMAFGQCRVDRSYAEVEARTLMLRHGHYGPWH